MSQRLPGYLFAPEPISEGGVEITDWPGKTEARAFKTFRLMSTEGYPWVDEETSDEFVFTMPRSDKHYVTIKLKAFDSAPPFTDAELTAFRTSFEETIHPACGWRYFAMVPATTVNNPDNW